MCSLRLIPKKLDELVGNFIRGSRILQTNWKKKKKKKRKRSSMMIWQHEYQEKLNHIK